MAVLVSLVGVLIATIGVVGLASPHSLIRLVEGWRSPARFWFSVVTRALIGAVFLAVAPDCRVPGVVQVVGWLSMLGAVLLLMIGRTGLDAFIESWLGPTLIRVAAPMAVAVGALLVYAGPVSVYDSLNLWL